MKATFLVSGTVIGLVAASVSFAAQPVPAMQLSDNLGDVITIDSTGSVAFSGIASCVAGTTCTTVFSSVAAGKVTWSGRIGPFNVPSAVGQTKPALASPSIDVSLQGLSTAASGGVLTVKWTDAGFSGSSPANMAAGTIFVGGSGSVTYTSYVDNSNVPFGTGVTVGTLGPVTSSGVVQLTGSGPTAQPFSMTNVLVVTLNPNSAFDTDFLLVATQSQPFGGCTVTQGGWGAPPHGNNPAAFLASQFSTAFPSGVTVGGLPFSLHFTSSQAIQSFLPQGGPPAALNATATDPTTTSAGVFAGQVLALDLNVALYHFGSLVLSGTGTSLDGKTVGQVLLAANEALAGGPLPAGFTYSSLNDLIDSLNQSFDGCVASGFAQSHLH